MSSSSTERGALGITRLVYRFPAQSKSQQHGVYAFTHEFLDVPGITFTIPEALPSGQYLVRMEAIALHVRDMMQLCPPPIVLTSYAILPQAASSYGGAQFYIGCGQVNVTGGGSGTPGPLVSIPGVYTGNVSVMHWSAQCNADGPRRNPES